MSAEHSAEDQSRILCARQADRGCAACLRLGREPRDAAGSGGLSAEPALNRNGECPQRVSTRYARAGLRIPAGTSWSYVTGVEADTAQEG